MEIVSNWNANTPSVQAPVLRSNIFDYRQFLPLGKMFPYKIFMTVVKSLARQS